MASPLRLSVGAAVGALVSSVALAGPFPFDDGFESGGLLTGGAPAGRWDWEYVPPGGCSHSASPAAAHSGAWGYRNVDNDTTAGMGTQCKLGSDPGITTPSLYVRFWFRIVSMAGPINGTEVMLAAANLQGPGKDLLHFIFEGPTLALNVGGRDLYSTNGPEMDAGVLVVGDWYLLEAATTGLGTDAGTRAAFVNGAPVGSTTNIDWSGLGPQQIPNLLLGENWSRERSSTLVFDYDDFRASAAPLASTLRLAAPAAVSANACDLVTVNLVDSITGAPATAPSDVVVSVTATGPTSTLFSDPGCTTSTTSATIAVGTDTKGFYLQTQGPPGTLQLQATNIDFIPASAQVVVDGGAGLQSYQVACDCSGGPRSLAPVWLGFAVFLGARRFRITRRTSARAAEQR